jgi:predicted kinase
MLTAVPTLVLTQGLPGSGKTTWAVAWVASDPGRRVRVNRDCLRDMLHRGCYDRPVTEEVVNAAQYAAVQALLVAGWDVVCDDTNLRPEVMAGWRSLAADVDAAVEVVDFTHVPVEVCIERDAGREDRGFPPSRWDGARTGERVIRESAGRHLAAGGMVTA